ncbi:MAG: hypothetical protein V1703_02700 [Candidatus Altiarchaeota archaeon]
MSDSDSNRKRVFATDGKDALRSMNLEEFKMRPRISHGGFESSSGHEHEIERILETAKKFKPYEKQK